LALTESLSVLAATPPRFSPEEAAAIAAEHFGVVGTAAPLGSERDQTFAVDDAVLKISNLGEEAEVLDLETAAILHVLQVDSSLPVARPRAVLGGTAYRATVEGADGAHFVRLFDRMRGRNGGPELATDAVYDYAATQARLNLALRGFFHPAAGRELLWDLKQAAGLRALLGAISDATRRKLIENVLDRYEHRVAARWPRLRAQIVHGDFNLDNVFLDDRDRVAGIVDFGDISHTAQVADFAIAVASLLRGRPLEEVFRIARIAIDGYESQSPLEPIEREVLGDLVAARLATIVAISAWRVERYPENADYIQAWDADSWNLLEHFDACGLDVVARELGAPALPVGTSELARRRRAVLGAALTPLTYREPVHVARGEGVWLFDSSGRKLLDAYNNVPVVGHCHPRVTEAVVRQTRLLNTHSRYLYEPLVELAERLAATMPPGSGLDTVMLVNSGSEANELAWRLATTISGHRDAIVTDHAYHGVTTAMADLSPEEWAVGYEPPHVRRVSPSALSAVDAGTDLAATFVDSAFTSDGIWTPPGERLQALASETRAAGGLFVADEVQAGYGRMGEHLWSFAQYGVVPDIVTLGKPMGNGYPVAAVVTRGDIFERFGAAMHVFSTFGGNPVAAQAALAVLGVIDDEALVDNAKNVGAGLQAGLEELRGECEGVVDVRGRGLLVGVELETAELAEQVVDGLRENGVLIGRTGRGENVLKIRPPLVFRTEHADMLVSALREQLQSASSSSRRSRKRRSGSE
jgi:4-aminobutyrate aminotransferase-like enzyme/Ser/Thr protein kinase RdoA (MazF antagonist)